MSEQIVETKVFPSTIDLSRLEEKLLELTGVDFEAAETQERAAGNNFPDVSFTKSFQARLAARALGINVYDLKAASLRDYSRACQMVFNFLFVPSDNVTQ